MNDLAERSLLTFQTYIIAIVSLGLTYQVRIMTLASTYSKKLTFKKSHLNA